jgi:NADH-quinone oxidoreductase subunit L
MTTIAVIGAFTALLAATIALRQFDLKKVFAYSTISQLGFMFVAVGALAPIAGVFHLVTHAFFKALLFLSSGVVMHAMAGELDMRKMSGIKKVLPITNILMLIGCLALAGFPPFSGFFSKDDIVNAAFHMSPLLGLVMLFIAFLTAYYTFRLYFRVFQGPLVVPPAPDAGHGHGHDSHGHDDHGHHNHEPMLMILPLIVLAIGAIGAGLLNFPGHASFSEGLGKFLEESPSISMAHKLVEASGAYPATQTAPLEANYWLMIISAAISTLGIYFAYIMHLKSRRLDDEMVAKFWPLAAVFQNKYWVDEIYQAFIVEPLRELGQLLANVFDRFIVDGLVNLAGMIPQAGGIFLKLTVQRGYLQGYAAAMLFGAAIILLVIFLH